jgi:hypothetical protein
MLARLARYAAAVALVLALILGFWLHLQKGMAADDDNLWLYYLTQKLTQSELAISYEQQVIDYARAKDGTAESLARLEMRRDYGANYILPITVGTGLSWLWPAPADQSRYSDYLARFMTTLFSLQAMLALLVVMLVVSKLDNKQLKQAVLWGSLALLVASVLPLDRASVYMVSGDIWANLGRFLLFPSAPYSVFGYTPRNTATLLLLAVMLLRWDNKTKAAYLLLLPCYLIHSSLTLLVALHLLAIDMLLHRQNLRQPVTLLAILVGLGYGASRETLWAYVSNQPLMLLAGGFVFAALFSLMVYVKLPAKLEALQTEAATPWRDIVALALLWGSSFLIYDHLIRPHLPAQQIIYFWGQLHGRLLAAVQPMLFVGLAFALLGLRKKRMSATPYVTHIFILLCLSISVFMASKITAHQGVLHRPIDSLYLIEAFLDKQEWTHKRGKPNDPNIIFTEAAVYYLLGKGLTYDTNPMPAVLATAWK